MMTWWRIGLNPEGLSQGDIIGELPFCVSVVPSVALNKGTGKGGKEIWTPSNPDKSTKQFLCNGAILPGVVLSHSCEIDKDERKARIIVAPIRPLNLLNQDIQETVLKQERRSLMPLPDIPTLGSFYADLRLITATDRALLKNELRIASMSDIGVKRLQAQLMAFFLRIDLAEDIFD